MKTLLKFLVPATLSFLITMGLSAQKPFFFDKEGVVLTYADKNAKGKITGYSQTTVTQIEGDPANCTVSYETQIMDAKEKPLLQNPMNTKITIENGTVKFDPSSFAGQLVEGMEVSGDNLLLPANVSVGDVLNDYTVTVAIGPVKTTTSYSNIKVTAAETLNISGNTIECFVVESTALAKVIGIKQEMIQKIWYGRGIGTVKTETYNKKGKLQTVQELMSVKGL